MSDWLYKGSVISNIDPKYKAFVYCITNLADGRKYIGLKTTVSPKYRVVKGQRKKNGYKESDWRTYWSSSTELQSDVERLGEDNFCREIIYFCTMKAHANYLELREQIDRRVLESPDLYYNSIVNSRVNRNHLKNLDFADLS